MKRRAFVRQTGTLLALSPIIAETISSCTKSTVKPNNTTTPPVVTPPVVTPPSNPPGIPGVKTLAPGEGGNIPTLANKSMVDGYANKQSYLPGENCILYLSTNTLYSNQKINVYDINYKLAFYIPVTTANTQHMQTDNPSQNGYGYTETVTITVPDVASGIYLIANLIPIIIKGTNDNVDMTVVYPSNTENAYCLSGGKDLYGNSPLQMVSFLRPMGLTYYASGFFKWLAKQSYTYNVIADIDVDSASNIRGKLLVLTGHSEYWTKLARQNFDAHVNAGKPALVLAGNSMYWHVRYNDAGDQLICYKSATADPTTSPLDKTVYWTYGYQQYQPTQSIGVDGIAGGYGIQSAKSFQGIKIADPKMILFNGLNLKRGDVIPCSSHELDAAPISDYDSDGFPIIDNSKLGFSQLKLIGYDIALDYFKPNKFNTATAIMFKKSQSSGSVINMSTTNWCTNLYFTDPKNQLIPTITKNAIDALLNDKDIFTDS